MVSPDSELRYHQNPELLVPINGDFAGKDVISLDQFDPKSLEYLFQVTDKLKPVGQEGWPLKLLDGVVVTLLFYEPSSRTRGSFDAATKQLGGQTIVVENPQQFSSVSKGETFEDTIRTFEAYGDAIVLRHPETGSALKAAGAAEFVPIINAGDGVGEHPTQALLDLYTVREHKGELSNIKGLMAGDLLNGRTIHSLIRGLSFYKGNEIYLLSPEKLRLSSKDFKDFEDRGITLRNVTSMDEVPKDLDFWYWTRVQKERFENEDDYREVNNQFIVDQEILNRHAGPNTILMHPLPRVGEIREEVDRDPRAVYLRNQIRNGPYIRMALLALVLGKIK